jgi:hypothetical protein
MHEHTGKVESLTTWFNDFFSPKISSLATYNTLHPI